MPAPTVLELRHVSKSFGGVLAVNGVSLSLQRGLRYALIGPNGAGKTTLFNLVSGHLRCDEGEVLLLGQPIQGLPPHEICRLGLARTFQVSSIFPSLTVLKNVEIARMARTRKTGSLVPKIDAAIREESMSLLQDVGLGDLALRMAGTLSYGDRKRLELAMALALEPILLLLDEPVAGVATHERWMMVDLINRLCEERQLTLLFTEHDMGVVDALSDWVAVLHRGSLLAQGTPKDIKGNEEIRRVYLGA